MNLSWYYEQYKKSSRTKYVPRVHGNGFIQLDISEAENAEPNTIRLHLFGDRRVPAQDVSTHIHDHTFSFISRVMTGRLINVVHEFWTSPGVYGPGSYHVCEAIPCEGEDTELRNMGIVLQRERASVEIIEPGQIYRMQPFVFHESLAQTPTLTVMMKTSKNHGKARVLVPIEKKPDNGFDRNKAMSPDDLWEILGMVSCGGELEVILPAHLRSWVKQ